MNRIYLAKAKLQGYRTIKNLDVKFNPGLNIVIGKNGSGKTNFITFLNDALTYNYRNLINSRTDLAFAGSHKFEISADKTIELNSEETANIKEYIVNDSGKFYLKSNGEITNSTSIEALQEEIYRQKLSFLPILLPHGLRNFKNNLIISSSVSFEVDEGTSSNVLLTITAEKENSYYSRAVAFDIFIKLMPIRSKIKSGDNSVVDEATDVILNYFNLQCDSFNESINSYLPIQKIRLSPSLKIYFDEGKKVLKVENILLEYLINDQWLPFSSLSDGTKRMFCLFADISVQESVFSDLVQKSADSKIILLEEPELGIHPHQLEQFMNFLKNASEDAQIIITTHSPQALDVLTKDTLGSLFICSYEPETGTTISNLNDNQTEKAKAYMDEMYLSDYWRYSDLEK